jgi:hypothetical protein
VQGDYQGQIAAGVPIDIGQHVQWMDYTIIGLNDWQDPDKYPLDWSNYEEPVQTAFTAWGEHPTAVPFYYSTRGILVNKNLFAQHEVEVPSGLTFPNTATWDDVIPILKEVSDPPDHYAMGFSVPSAQSRGHIHMIARGYGVNVVQESSELGKFWCDLDSTGGVDTFQWYHDAVNVHEIAPIEVLEWAGMDRPYALGTCATVIGLGPWVVETMITVGEEAHNTLLNTEYTYCPTDGRTAAPLLEAMSGALLNTGYQPEMAWKFLSEHVLEPEAVLRLNEWPTTLPGGPEIVEEFDIKVVQLQCHKEANQMAGVYDHWWFKNWYEISKTAMRRPACPWGKPGTFIVDHLSKVIRQEESAAVAAETCAEEINDYFKENDLYGE